MKLARGEPAVVTGMMFFRPVAGVVYQILHYMNALRSLGFTPVYVERTGWWFLDPVTLEVSPDPSGSIRAVTRALANHGFGESWALRVATEKGEEIFGIDDSDLLDLCRRAPVLLNVTGTQALSDELLHCDRKLYVESDPFVAQFDVASGDATMRAHLDAHDHLFTFGMTINGPRFPLPLEPYSWTPTRQAIDVDLWATDRPPAHDRFTTVTSWFNDEKDRTWDGDTYHWTKGREFQRFLDVTDRWPERFEMAVTESEDASMLLKEHRWRVSDAHSISADLDTYRHYIQDSYGEFTVARDQYVRPHTGWFSDRSACYLAAGRPVITQQTGFSEILPTGKGLFAFSTPDEIDVAIDAILSDPIGNQMAAREVAREYFDGTRVVSEMLHEAGVV